MNNYVSRQKVVILCLMMTIVVCMGVIAILQVKVETLQEQSIIGEPAPKTFTGEYTIIHYPSGGWANAIYITEYKLDGQVIWYKEKGSTEDKPIWFSSVIMADGWLYGEELANYGYWITDDLGL
jgi:hypothetical protein